MTIRFGIALGLVAVLGFAPAVTFAQSAAMDKKFVADALQAAMAEVELGTLAGEKASSDAVKQFGKRMAEEHAKAGEALKTLAQTKGIRPPAEIDQPHSWLRDKLAKLSGAAFDRRYVSEMVKDHKKDVRTFQHAAGKAKDPDVKAFAAKTVPMLQQRLKQIEALHAQLQGTAKTDKK